MEVVMKTTPWKAVPIFLVTVVLALGAIACGDDDDDDGGGGGAGAQAEDGQDKVKTAIVLPCATSDPWCKQGFDAEKALEADGAIAPGVTTNPPKDPGGVTRVWAQY